MSEISPQTQNLIKKYQVWHQSLQKKEGVPVIHVDEVASRVASFYEKIKGVVDWQEEHLLRKRAIERILKRRIIFKKESKSGMAEPLAYELIRGGHFPNDSIPESQIPAVQQIIDKYFFILENFPKRNEKEDSKLREWLLDIASYELEETLAPPAKETALMDYMTELMKERLKISQGIVTIGGITEEEKNIQIYIAIQRALFKLDSYTIGYNLLEKQYPEWPRLAPFSPLLLEITKNICFVKSGIEKALNHPLADKLYALCEKYDTPYLVLGDLITENPTKAEENLQKPEVIEGLIEKVYNKRLFKLKGRARRAAVYSTLSVFITKVALALAIEIPVDKYLTHEFSYLSLGINILFPPLLMFLLVASLKLPGKENLQRIVMEVIKIAFQREKKEVYEIRTPKKRGKIMNAIIFGVYSFTFFVSFGVIIWGLRKLNFGILSMFIFLFFVSVVSFLGMRIRERKKELTIEEKKETFLKSLFDFFCLPIIRIGKWFSEKLSDLNIALIISILIDTPFFTFVEFLEQWRYFLKEKKEEIH